MAKNKKLDLISFGKIHAIIFGCIGLLLGILYSFGGLLIDTLVSLSLISSAETPGLSFGTILAFGALFIMPILFAMIGFVFGIIGALLFNIFVKFFGKVDLDLK